MTSIKFSGRSPGIQVGRNDGSITAEFYPSHSSEDIDRTWLQALRCPDSFLVKNRLKKAKDKLLRRSFDWVLRTVQYRRWRAGDVVCLLWIKGGAGKGKTMMSIGLIEALSQEEDQSAAVAYFFFQNSDNELKTLAALIKGVILRLVTQCMELKEVIRSRWDVKNDRFIDDFSSWQVLWDVLMEILDRCTRPRIYIIVDALDECQDDDMASFLKLVVRNGFDNPKKVKWLLMSRPSEAAERALIPGHEQVQVSLELNSESVHQSVQTYISSKVDDLGHQNRYEDTLREEVKSHLSLKAEGTFLWVSLVCKELEDISREDVLPVMQNVPPGLHALYGQKLHELLRRDSESRRDIRILQTMTLVYRPLKVEEIPVVTGLTIDRGAIEAVAARCASFIVIRESYIEFIHQSACEFLKGEHTLTPLNSHGNFHHNRIVINCVSQLSERLKANLLDLPPHAKSEEISSFLELRPHHELNCLDYAATFWVQHLQELDQKFVIESGIVKGGLVSKFLHAKLLEWMECLSLLNQLKTAIDDLERLLDILKDGASEYEFLQDAARFLRRHFKLVEQCPLQIYSSALIFSPRSSIVRSEYLKKVPPYLITFPDTGNEWESYLKTMDTARVWAVSFAPGGTELVSGSSDGLLKLWNSTTGDCKSTMRTGESSRIYAVAFSPDGKTIAAASDDRLIRVYDVASGSLERLIRTSEWKYEYPRSLLFSRDGVHIISGSTYGMIKYWDSTTGEVRKSVKGHSGPVYAMDISHDGKQLISGSSDRTVKLWDVITGNVQKVFDGHSGPVYTVYLSPDGMTIASGSYDKTIKIWDTRAGVLLNTIKKHQGPVYVVRFSPSGGILASGSPDMELIIWDAVKGSSLKTFQRYPDPIHALDFSPNGRALASGSSIGSIKIWDTATLDLPSPVEQTRSMIRTVAFSPDGKLVASSESLSQCIDIWNSRTGYHQSTLALHPGSVEALAFTPDNKKILSSAYDGTLNLLDIESGHQKTIGKHHSRVKVLVFSPDGDWTALGSVDGTISIWDHTTGLPQRTISDHSKAVTGLAFSSDGKKIASSSLDRTIKIWDVTTVAKPVNLWEFLLPSFFQVRPGKEIRTVNELHHLEFTSDMRNVITTSEQGNSRELRSLFVKDDWVYYGQTPFLRLSTDGCEISYDSYSDWVVVGCTNGQLSIFHIDRQVLHCTLQPFIDSRLTPSLKLVLSHT